MKIPKGIFQKNYFFSHHPFNPLSRRPSIDLSPNQHFVLFNQILSQPPGASSFFLKRFFILKRFSLEDLTI